MSNRIARTVALLALTSFIAVPALAQSDDPPARVGRVSLAQGQVSVASDIGAEMTPAQVNWPVTSGNTISTAAGSRTELRIGSTSIRLDGDSSLEVLQLDDQVTRLRLHYGSASVRVLNADALAGFELETPQARVRLEQPGRVRVDAERVRDTSAITVFDGAALVDGGGSELTLRAGKRAEFGDDDVRTLAAVRDGFDDWSLARDRYDDGATSSRYVTIEMTGYEDLDRYGSWRDDPDYGPLWTPSVAATWVPYRDGSWTWLDPWGWTWVDDAPWGYAPFHYGRWVQVHNRWAWAPGRRHEHLVWAPALVGWVGGAGWNVAFRDRNRPVPAAGWYPLSPHDRFVPSWHASDNHQRWLNEHVRDDPRRPRDWRPQGLTVVPQDRFGQRGRIDVPRTPHVAVTPAVVQHAPAGAPPAAPAWANRPHRDGQPGRGQGLIAGPGRIETGRSDSGRIENVRQDAGRPDNGRIENVRQDAGRIETGRPDGGRIDTARQDNGRLETGRPDGGAYLRQPRPGYLHGPVTQRAEPVQPGQVPPATPAQGLPVTSPTPHLPQQPLSTVNSPTPHQPPQPLAPNSPTIQVPQTQSPLSPQQQQQQQQLQNGWRRDRDGGGDRNDRGDRGDRREQIEEWRRNRPQAAPAPAQPQALAASPPPAAPRIERQERPEQRFEQRSEARNDRPEPRFEPSARPAPAAAPAPRPAPAPAAPAAPPKPREEHGSPRSEDHGKRQQER